MNDHILESFPFDVTWDGHKWRGERAECFEIVAKRTSLPWPMRMLIRPFMPGTVVLTPAIAPDDQGAYWISSVQHFRITPRYGLRCTGELIVEKGTQPFGARVLQSMIDESERRAAEAVAAMQRGDAKPSGWVAPIEGD